jgi:branched-chain amino acid aminotransferase
MLALDDLIVYHRGDFRPYGDARIGLMTHAFLYGTACFEGIRAFWNPDREQLYVFEPTAHYKRLGESAKFLLMSLPGSPDELNKITAELCRRNGFRSDVYIRPVVFKSEETFGVRLDDLEHDFFIVAFPNSKYLESNEGLDACVSSWRRTDDNALPARSKINGSYVNSALAKSEARAHGFDEAIVLSADGHVSESSAANLFVVRDGVVSTPDVSNNILEGVTRRIVKTILEREVGVRVVERAIDRTELYSADEIILCGTGVGIAWLRSLDRRTIGDGLMGSITDIVTETYHAITRGRALRDDIELHAVYALRQAQETFA